MTRTPQILTTLVASMRPYVETCVLPGAILPSERALSRMFGVSPSSINRAMRILAEEGYLLSSARSGWQRTGNPGLKTRHTGLRVGIITRRPPAERSGHLLYSALEKEAAERRITLIDTPSYRLHRSTSARNRPDISRIPWREFDVALLIDSEDAQTLGDPVLSGQPVVCVDEDATDYGLPSVAFDNECAGRLLASWLFDAGHRTFAATQECNEPGWTSDSSWAARLYGFEKQLGRLGACVLPEWRIPVSRQRRAVTYTQIVKDFASRWLDAPENVRPDALLFTEGRFFLKAGPLMQDAGLPVGSKLTPATIMPVEVSWPAPEVARVVFSTAALAEQALNLAAKLADSNKIQPTCEYLPPVLIKPIV